MNDILLFDYQTEMVRRVQEAFRTHRSVMVQMPTGTGKTYLLAAIVELFTQGKVWIVAHRRELVAQIIDTLKRFSLSPTSTNIKVMSIQWLTLHYREMKEAPSLLVIDEAHHAVAETYAQVMRTSVPFIASLNKSEDVLNAASVLGLDTVALLLFFGQRVIAMSLHADDGVHSFILDNTVF